ncbi:MAG: helix-turn-helix domain-containing protein [Janthinobacterium lividum]
MLSTSKKPSHVTKGSALDDLGLTREEVTTARIKADLWRELVAHIRGLKLTQKDMAKRLGIHQPEVSSLLSGKLAKFSAGTLIHYAVVLNMGVTVKLTAPRPKKGVVKTLGAVSTTVRHSRDLELASA